MRNFTFHFRPTETIYMKYETIKRAAKKLTPDCTAEIEKAMRLYYFVHVPRHSCNQFSLNLKWISAAATFGQEKWLSGTEEQSR